MPGKNIVLCSDGTGNTAIKARGTNVFKLYEAVDIQGHKYDQTLTPQVAFYDDGVGTSRLAPVKLIGGAFGVRYPVSEFTPKPNSLEYVNAYSKSRPWE